MVKISVVIVNWNDIEHLKPNLERLFSIGCTYPFEVFVVDNGSNDGSAAMVREKFPQVHLIQNDWDAGFATANNQALRLINGEIAILLNPDMLVEKGTLEKTHDVLMADKSIGVLGVRLNKPDGTPIQNVRRLPDLISQLSIVLKLAKLFPRLTTKYLYADFDYTKSQDVPQVRGSYFAMRKDTLKQVGLLDSDYHIWFEEVDYCQQVQKAGMRVRYEASVSCTDFVGQSFKKMKHLEKQRIFTASMVRYFKKWKPWWQTALIMTARPIGIAMAAMADVLKLP